MTTRDQHFQAAEDLDQMAARCAFNERLAGARDPDNDGLPHPTMFELICLKI